MINKRSVWFTLALVVGLSMMACGGGGTSGGTGHKTAISIGVSASMSGATAFYSQEVEKGVRVAVDELNASDDKFTFSYVVADDQCSPDGGAQAYGKLADVNHVDVILGSPCSAAVLGGMPILSRSQIPGMTAAATNPTIGQQSGVGGNRFSWRMQVDDAIMARAFARYIADQGVRTVATMAVNNDFGRGAVATYDTEFKNDGITIADHQYYTQASGEFRPQLTAISAKHPDAMLLIGQYPDAVVMRHQMQELSMLNIKMFTRGDVVSQPFVELAKDPHLGDGIQEATYWDASLASDPRFVQSFKKEYSAGPSLDAYVSYYAVKVFALAAHAAGGGGPANLEKGLSRVNWDSPMGAIRFDDHNQGHTNTYIVGYENGKITMVKALKS
jgi:branched-chain amino acid transport system substrate-binding protein